jgi:hypothetical protein
MTGLDPNVIQIWNGKAKHFRISSRKTATNIEGVKILTALNANRYDLNRFRPLQPTDQVFRSCPFLLSEFFRLYRRFETLSYAYQN